MDVGAGVWPLSGSRPIENHDHENAYKIFEENNSLDYIFSSHLLEHLDRPQQAIHEWVRVVKPGGCIFLYLPHPACRMWDYKHFKYYVWQSTPDKVVNMLEEAGLKIVEKTEILDIYFSFYVIAQM